MNYCYMLKVNVLGKHDDHYFLIEQYHNALHCIALLGGGIPLLQTDASPREMNVRQELIMRSDS